MRTILISILWKLAAQLLEEGIADELMRLVKSVMNFSLSGAEKREIVLTELKTVGGSIGAAVAKVSANYLNLALEVAVAKTRLESGKN